MPWVIQAALQQLEAWLLSLPCYKTESHLGLLAHFICWRGWPPLFSVPSLIPLCKKRSPLSQSPLMPGEPFGDQLNGQQWKFVHFTNAVDTMINDGAQRRAAPSHHLTKMSLIKDRTQESVQLAHFRQLTFDAIYTFLQILRPLPKICPLWGKELWESLAPQLLRINQGNRLLYIN